MRPRSGGFFPLHARDQSRQPPAMGTVRSASLLVAGVVALVGAVATANAQTPPAPVVIEDTTFAGNG